MNRFERHPGIVLSTTVAVGVILVLAGIEGLLAGLLAHPGWVASPTMGEFLLDGLRGVYAREDWSVLQADPDAVYYDPELTYLLRPGTWRFANREFDTTLHANSAGLRDDEASLAGPDLIVLGDSYALGWGVEQDETFPRILETRTGLTVLNASMASFGTAREVMLLRRLDTSRARAVVVQYFANDFRENRAFVAGGLELTATPEDAFEQWRREVARASRYRPLDYLRAFIDRSTFFPELDAASPEEVASTCLDVLDASDELGELPIFFLQVDPWTEPRYNIVEAMAELLGSGEYPDLDDRLTLLRLEDDLVREDFFLLDPHLRPSGHEKIAARLLRALRDS